MADKDIIQDAKEAFATFSDEENEQRTLMLADYRFRAGEQWPDEWRRLRENDPNGARPCLTLDRTNQHVRQVVNDARLNRSGMKVRPVDGSADPQTAKMLNGLLRHIESKPTSKADIAYDWALECAATAGLGWFRITTESVDAAGNQEPRILRVSNPLSVYTGTGWSEPDGCDIECALVTYDMPRKEYDRTYRRGKKSDQKNPCSFEDAVGDEVEWMQRDTVRIAEYFVLEDLVKDEPGYGRYRKRVKWYKVSAKEVLDSTEFPASYIPLVPVIGSEIWVGNKRILVGMVRPAMDAQRAYNFNASAFAEHVSLSPRAKWLAAEGQLDGYEEQWRTAHKSSNPVLIAKATVDGNPVPPPARIFGPEVPQGLVQGMAQAERDLQSAMGQYGPSLGAPSNERSGIAIREKKSEGDRGSFHYVDNLTRSVRHGCTICIEAIQRTMDVPRIARILGEDGRDGMAEINPDQEQAYGRFEQADGSYRQVYNPSVGMYDVVPGSGPAYPTLRAEAAAAMIQIVQANPAILQTHGDLIFASQDWPDADRFAERFRLLLPPQVLEAEAAQDQGKPLDPEAVAAVMQREQQIQQMNAQMQEMGKALQAAQAKASDQQLNEIKADNENKKLQIEQRRLDIDYQRALNEKEKIDAEVKNKNVQTVATVAGLEDAHDAREQAQEAQQTQTLDALLSAVQQLSAKVDAIAAGAQNGEANGEDRTPRVFHMRRTDDGMVVEMGGDGHQ